MYFLFPQSSVGSSTFDVLVFVPFTTYKTFPSVTLPVQNGLMRRGKQRINSPPTVGRGLDRISYPTGAGHTDAEISSEVGVLDLSRCGL